jgi:hypothetical protein
MNRQQRGGRVFARSLRRGAGSGIPCAHRTDAGDALAAIVYYILPTGTGWRVSARGFTWNFRTREEGVEFALRTARDFAAATGRATSVRLQDGSGPLREVQAFAGVVRLPTGAENPSPAAR